VDVKAKTKNSSLANKLTAWYALSAFVLVFGTSYFLYWSTVRAREADVARSLYTRFQTLLLVLKEGGGKYDLLKARIEQEWAAKKSDRAYVRVSDSKGNVIALTPNNEKSISDIFQQMDDHSVMDGQVRKIFDPDNHRSFRVLFAHIDDVKDNLNICLILDRTDDFLLLEDYRKRLYIALSLSFVLCIFVGWRIAARGMRPIANIAEQAGRIGSSNLYQRIDVKALPVELSKLAITFNEVLTRLEDAFNRLSRFSADLAHELRTPISNLTGELEVTLGKHRTEENYRDVLGSSLEECMRLSRIIDSMLFLARCENPQNNVKKESINVKKELQTVLDFFEASVSEAQISTHLEVDDDIYINAERTLFQRAVGNLLSNALKQTPPAGTIRVSATEREKFVAVEIEDTGRGISPEHLPHVFERFYRVDPSRSKDSGGAGLGLAIVKSITAVHGGSVEMNSELGKGTKVTLSFPTIELI
jgi:two-component system, OmpR family, heavy metal sensor histidine kinase CusS